VISRATLAVPEEAGGLAGVPTALGAAFAG